MKTLLPAIISKLLVNESVTDEFGERIYALWNPNLPNLLTTCNKFPFIGVVPVVNNRIHTDAGQMVEESLQVRVYIYHELYKQEGTLAQKLLDLQELVRAALEYDANFAGTVYSGSPIIDAFCIQMGEIEPFTAVDHPMAARISLTMEYGRVTEEVLV